MGVDLFMEGAYMRKEAKVRFLSGAVPDVGRAVCYDQDAAGDGVATLNAARTYGVQAPDRTNNLSFAGIIVDRGLGAGPCEITIAVPERGSYCRVLLSGTVTLAAGARAFSTFVVGGDDAGKYCDEPGVVIGAGCVRILQSGVAGGLVLAELMVGEQSGDVEYVDVLAAGGALTIMVGGKTRFGTQNVSLTANATCAVAAGTYPGQGKAFECDYDMGDNFDIIVTITGNGVQRDGSTALQTLVMDDDGDRDLLQMAQTAWVEIERVGTTVT